MRDNVVTMGVKTGNNDAAILQYIYNTIYKVLYNGYIILLNAKVFTKILQQIVMININFSLQSEGNWPK